MVPRASPAPFDGHARAIIKRGEIKEKEKKLQLVRTYLQPSLASSKGTLKHFTHIDKERPSKRRP